MATGSWSGEVSIFSLPDTKQMKSYTSHIQRASSVHWHPQSGLEPTSVDLCSSSTDGSILLYSLNTDNPVCQLEGHELRVAAVKFHPSGRYIGTVSHDATYRLFDIETQEELVLQESGDKLHTIDFHCDGSLVAIGYNLNNRIII